MVSGLGLRVSSAGQGVQGKYLLLLDGEWGSGKENLNPKP